MSRVAKIGRLPRETREVLNERLRDGESGSQLVEWLNARREVKEALAKHFGGIPVSEQNLSAWRRGGYRAWLLHQDELEDKGALTEGMSAVLAVRFAGLLSQWGRSGTKKFQRELESLRVVSREVARLRKGGH